eukprot:m.417584 g.417584  ORF g.417584 m.417584 type:complete len:102 (+) comp30521_c0_seq1:543-848(+)
MESCAHDLQGAAVDLLITYRLQPSGSAGWEHSTAVLDSKGRPQRHGARMDKAVRHMKCRALDTRQMSKPTLVREQRQTLDVFVFTSTIIRNARPSIDTQQR